MFLAHGGDFHHHDYWVEEQNNALSAGFCAIPHPELVQIQKLTKLEEDLPMYSGELPPGARFNKTRRKVITAQPAPGPAGALAAPTMPAFRANNPKIANKKNLRSCKATEAWCSCSTCKQKQCSAGRTILNCPYPCNCQVPPQRGLGKMNSGRSKAHAHACDRMRWLRLELALTPPRDHLSVPLPKATQEGLVAIQLRGNPESASYTTFITLPSQPVLAAAPSPSPAAGISMHSSVLLLEAGGTALSTQEDTEIAIALSTSGDSFASPPPAKKQKTAGLPEV